jgi:serine/threonine protein kinase
MIVSPNRRFQRVKPPAAPPRPEFSNLRQFDEIIGQGGFKTVYKAYDSLEGCEVAWNTVKLTGIPEDEKKRIVKEVKLLYTLKHPNILEFRGTWPINNTEIVFITEVLSGGSLKKCVARERRRRARLALTQLCAPTDFWVAFESCDGR